MTQIDLELKSMAKSALREYISSRGAIDWEQRSYEIAKEVLCAWCASGASGVVEDWIADAVCIADALIKELREGGEK